MRDRSAAASGKPLSSKRRDPFWILWISTLVALGAGLMGSLALGMGCKKSSRAKGEAAAQSAPILMDVERYKVPLHDDDLALGGDAPKVTIVVFSNYACDPCRRLWQVMQNLVEDYGDQIRVVHRSVAISGYQGNDLAVEAAYAAAAQGKFWEMHRRLFDFAQDLSMPMLREHAKAIGLDLKRFDEDMQTGAHTARRLQDKRGQELLGVIAGPASFVNGVLVLGFRPEKQWHGILKMEMKRARELLQEGAKPDELYKTMQEGARRGPIRLDPALRAKLPAKKARGDSDGSNKDEAGANKPAPIQSPDPKQRYALDAQGAYGWGSPEAPVWVVEFNDVECPFGKKANREVFSQLRQTYGDKLRWVTRHMPLPSHPRASGAARAAWAAAQQGAFWPFHQALMGQKPSEAERRPKGSAQAAAKPGGGAKDLKSAPKLSAEALSGPLGRRRFEAIAQELGLDLPRFRRDFESPASKAAVDRDLALSDTLGLSATPSLFINGRYISGLWQVQTYTKLIDEELALAKKTQADQNIPPKGFHPWRMSTAIPPEKFPNAKP